MSVAPTRVVETDADIVARSLADPSAFATIFDRHFGAVHRYVHRRAGADVADDVAAETFRIAFERRRRWSQSTVDARPWLLGIATNVLRRHRRVEERRLRALARGQPDKWAVLDDTAVATRLDSTAARSALAAALAKLSPRDRDALALVALGDLSHAEAALALGIRVGTVASRLNRARSRVAAELARSTEDVNG